MALSACSSDDDSASGGAGAAGKAGTAGATGDAGASSLGGASTAGGGGSAGEAGSPAIVGIGGAADVSEGGAAGTIGGVGTRACIRAGEIDVSALSTLKYVIDGEPDPDLILCRGSTYAFVLDESTTGHPFYIKTVDNSTGTGNVYAEGVTNNGHVNGTVTFTVPADAPDTLYYHCSNHAGMGGKITIVD